MRGNDWNFSDSKSSAFSSFYYFFCDPAEQYWQALCTQLYQLSAAQEQPILTILCALISKIEHIVPDKQDVQDYS